MKNYALPCLIFILFFSACSQSPRATDADKPSPLAAANLGDIHTRTRDGAPMVYVPAGAFRMGSTEAQIEQAIALCKQYYGTCNRWFYEREGPAHTVSLSGFWLDQNEVSNAQYHQCVEAGVCPEPSACKKGEPTYADPGKSDHPVVCIDWQEAQAYCAWAGGRLPTEAEWEYAFRGGNGSIYPWGDSFEGDKLNYCDVNCENSFADSRFDDGYSKTSPVASYPEGASWCGALGMGGNVSEWAADWFGDYSSEEASDPGGPASGGEKMIKGCSWYFPLVYCRGATRASVAPETRFDYFGFRCMLPVEESTSGHD